MSVIKSPAPHSLPRASANRDERWRARIVQRAAIVHADASWHLAAARIKADSARAAIRVFVARLPLGDRLLRLLRRAASFGMVGGFVALVGLALQFALVQYAGMDKHLAYFIQSIVSIELNFTLNNYFTWSDRRGAGLKAIARTWLKFHAVRVVTVTLNQILYAALLWLGLQYLLANVVCILIILVVNFWSGDKFIFSAARGSAATLAPPPDIPLEPAIVPGPSERWFPRANPATRWPSVSVIIPVKHDESVIAETVASLLAQDYQGPVEIILVGDRDDTTWAPIQPLIDASQLTIIEAGVYNAHRAINAKRNIGLRQARGRVIALIESDMTLPAGWITSGVERIQRGWPVVVGSIERPGGGLLAAHLDTSAYFRRAPVRDGASGPGIEDDERVVDVERFGSAAYRLPIMSHVFLAREVLYYTHFPDPDFDTGYDDYQWHWELARADVAILSAPAVRATRRAPLTWRGALTNYFGAGIGCARFIRAYPGSILTVRRLEQAALATAMLALVMLVTLVTLIGLTQPGWLTILGLRAASSAAPSAMPQNALAATLFIVTCLATLLGIGAVNAVRARRAYAILYPFLTIFAGLAFLAGLARGLIQWVQRSNREVQFAVTNVKRQTTTITANQTAEPTEAERAWSAGGPQNTGSIPTIVRKAPAWPAVSVVVPVKNSQKTIAAMVNSLLDQDYPGPVEILLVGDVHDPTWEPIREPIAQGRVTIIEVTIKSANRDANAKRSIGLRAARGAVLALTDSDMVLPRDWVSTGINYMLKGWPCVAGPMRGARGDFWDTYADQVQVGSKTPRFAANVIVDQRRFDAGRHKPPITANVFFTREVLADAGDFDSSFTHSYEDYSWFWQVCRAGTPILCTPDLTADHYHRQGWKQLIRQYTRAGRGCGDFVCKYPESPLSRVRLMQLMVVWTAVSVAATTLLYSLASFAWPLLLNAGVVDPVIDPLEGWTPIPPGLLIILAMSALGVGGLLALGVRNALATRRAVATIYPFITLVFALAFSRGLSEILARAAARWASARRVAVAGWAVFGGIIALGMTLRLWNLDTKPGVEWDEPVYANVAWHLLRTGDQYLKPEVGRGIQLYFSQPPFYFGLLAAWYWLTHVSAGDIIQAARTLAALMSVATLVFLYLLLRRRQGLWALIPTLLIAVDSWIVFSSRISWIDNTAIPIGVAGLWLYDRAMKQERSRAFVLAGAVLGAAALFKYLAIYFCIAVVFNWLITGRRRKIEHAILLLTVLNMIVVYVFVSEAAFAFSPDNPFLLQHLHQLARVTDHVSSRGNVTNLQQVAAALINQYKVFALTIALCAAGALVLIADAARCVMRRSLAPLRPHSIEASWALAAFVVFGAVQIKFINYFEYVMIPLLVYLCVRSIALFQQRARAGASRAVWARAPWATWTRAVVAALLITVVGLNLFAYTQRIADRQDDTFVSVQQYAASIIPARDQVVTEQPIGTMIRQPYCEVNRVHECAQPKWIILFDSLTEPPPPDPQLNALLGHSVLRAVYYGFKETVYIYQVEPLASTRASVTGPTGRAHIAHIQSAPLTQARMHWMTPL